MLIIVSTNDHAIRTPPLLKAVLSLVYVKLDCIPVEFSHVNINQILFGVYGVCVWRTKGMLFSVSVASGTYMCSRKDKPIRC